MGVPGFCPSVTSALNFAPFYNDTRNQRAGWSELAWCAMNSTFEQPKESPWHSLLPSALSSLQLLAVVLLVTSVSLLPDCWSATIGLYKIIAGFTFTEGERVKSSGETLCIRMGVCAGPCA